MQDDSLTPDSAAITSTGAALEFEALQTVITALQPLNIEARQRILAAVSTFLRTRIPSGPASRTDPAVGHSPATTPEPPAYSNNAAMSPKEFLIDKQPRTDVERIACLAFYLTHYENMSSFKTLDLSKLNTRAAQPKFANAAQAAKNAVLSGYLVPSSAGQRQLGAAGEQFVRALPDRDAAKSAMSAARPKRRPRPKKPLTQNKKG